MQTLCGRSDAIALSDSFEVGETEELRVVCCRGEVMITSAEARRTGVACSGELQLKILLCREGEGERPYTVTRKIPVSGEAAYLKDVRDGAELLLLSTNDSWFGTSRALYMHVAQARLRAIENSRGVLRAASTGVSCVISPTGAINASIGASTEGYVVADVLLSERDTPYTLVGNAFVYASIAFVFSLFAYQCARKYRKK
jgi:hypothetical protein